MNYYSDLQQLINESIVEDQVRVLKHLELIHNSMDLTSFLNEYISFNKVFAPGVLSLVSKVDTSDFFNESIASTISANILYAAVDEYFNENLEISTHCNLAKDFFNSVLLFYNISPLTLKNDMNSFKLHSNIMDNYLYMKPFPNEYELFHSLGFHLGAEKMGSIEFKSLDNLLKLNFKNLYENLSKNDKYKWISIHTFAEDEHCDYAINAIQLALKFYSGTFQKKELYSFIQDGYESFRFVQNDFFEKALK